MKTMKMIALNGPHHKRYVVYHNNGKIVINTRNKNTAKLLLKNDNIKLAA
jgi:stringent starvation protein B